MKRGLALFLAAMLTALALTACGGSAGGSVSSSAADTAVPGTAGPSADSGGESWKAAVQEFGFDAPADPAEIPEEDQLETDSRLKNAKMIYTAHVGAETTDFDACAAALEALVEQMGGYLEYASTGNYGDWQRDASYTARIPSARFEAFLKNVGELSHVLSQERNAQNISEEYYDTESRLTTQRTKMERLQSLLARAENMEDIIALESAIAETELQIEQLTGSLRRYDALVDFATVEIQLWEVTRLSTVEEAPPTFASKLGNAFTDGLHAFGDFLQSLAIFLAYNWTWLALLAVIAAAAVGVSRRRQARRAETFAQAKVRESGFFRRREKDEAKKPDDKQPKD